MNEDGRQLNWSTMSWGDTRSPLPALDPALMAMLLENVSTRIAVVGLDRRYLYANREALRFMGLPADRVIGRPMSEVLDRGVYLGFVPIFQRLFAGESLHLSGWVNYERQGLRYREQALVPYRPGGGPVQAVVVCGLDHTDLRQSEAEIAQRQEELRTSEALKAAIFDHAQVALISTDAHGRIVEFNPAAAAMFGHAREDALGRPAGELVIPQRYRSTRGAGMQRLAGMLGKRVEMSGLRADGSEFPMEIVIWRTDTGGTAFYTASIADVSERHDAAREIERQREALRQSEKLSAMGSLLAGVAHELNNPLAIVMGRATLLEEKCEDRPEFQQDARRIIEAAERCGRIVRTFLNMARHRPAEKRAVQLNEVVRNATDMLGYAYRSHDIELYFALDPALPEVEADGDQLCQVVLNLLVNAQQALAPTPPGFRCVEVSTGVEQATDGSGAGHLWLRVVDNGPGVPAAVQGRLFEPFYTTKAEGLGTGLGLSVSRSVAEQHGGELVLEHTPTGASFRLRLPMTAAAPAPAVAAGSFPEPVPEAVALARVLVVDDEPELADLMRAMLEHAGCDVAVAESGAVALELLEAARFDAVVSDLRMPDMDGASLWRTVSARFPALSRRFLFITGDALSRDVGELVKASGCAALDKPFSRAEFVDAVKRLF
jgi:two-component system NtrC family sensor kinase